MRVIGRERGLRYLREQLHDLGPSSKVAQGEFADDPCMDQQIVVGSAERITTSRGRQIGTTERTI